jgi:hypothetical protein
MMLVIKGNTQADAYESGNNCLPTHFSIAYFLQSLNLCEFGCGDVAFDLLAFAVLRTMMVWHRSRRGNSKTRLARGCVATPWRSFILPYPGVGCGVKDCLWFLGVH